jgi:tetratricopeptide (TPR) repeat protein
VVESEHPNESILLEFMSAKLRPDARARVEEHLGQCSDCWELLTVLSEARDSAHRAIPDADAHLAPHWNEGMVVGRRFELRSHASSGGMGTVFRARDLATEADVAVKAMLELDPEHEERFEREARVLSELTHPAIVRYVAHGTTRAGQGYLVMEWLEGEDLATRLRRGPLNVREAVLLAGRIAEGLAAAHELGVVHRDVKPSNVFLPGGEVSAAKLIDFGIARAPRTGKRATRTGALLGTPGYMAPEQARGKSVIDTRVDVFSLGCVLYECLTGTRAFEGDDLLETLARILLHTPRRPRSATSDVPRALDNLVMAMLEKDPARRPKNCEEVRAALSEISEKENLPTSLPLRMLPRVRHLPVWAAVFLGVLGALGLVAWRVLEGRHALSALAAVPATGAGSAPDSRETTALILGIENRTTRPVLDGIADTAIASALYESRWVTSIARSDLRALAADLGETGHAIDEHLGQRLAARDKDRVVTVRGAVVPKGAGYSVSVKMTGADGSSLAAFERAATDDSRVMPTLGLLARDLLMVLGEAVPRDPALSEKTGWSPSLDADHELMMGKELGNSGDYEGAVTHLKLAVELDPEFARAHITLGLELANAGRNAEATAAFERGLLSVDRLPTNVRMRYLAGYHLQIGDLDRALAEFQKLVGLRPTDSGAETGLSNTYVERREFGHALEVSMRAAKDHPSSAIVQSNLALARLDVGDFEGAARDAQAVNAAFARPPPNTWLCLALAEVVLGHRGGALAAYANLEKRAPSQAASGRADLAIYEGRLVDAVDILMRGIEADVAAKDDEASTSKWATLAEVRLRQGDKPGALAAAANAIGFDGTTTPYRAAEVYLDAGESEKAAKLAARFAARDATDPRMYAKLLEAHALRTRGKARDALAKLKEAQALSDSWLGHFALGRAYLDLSDFPAAEKEFEACLARKGETAWLFGDTPTLREIPEATYFLARAREGLGRAGANDLYLEVLRGAPPDERDTLLEDARRRSYGEGGRGEAR